MIIINDTKLFKKNREKKLTLLKENTNYEEAVKVVINDTTYYFAGGYESSQKLDAKRRLVIENEGTVVQFLTSDDEVVNLSLEMAKTVCLAVANDYEIKFYAYKSKKKQIEACTTVEELEAIEV